MAEKVINIGGRFHDTSSKHTVTGANEILDDDLQKKQNVINAEQCVINAEQQEFNQEQEGVNADTYRKNDVYNKEETNNIISRTPETDVIVVNTPEEIEVKLNPDSTETGFFNTDGSINSNPACTIKKYSVTPGNKYYFTDHYSGPGTTMYCVGWFDENGNIVSYEPYNGTSLGWTFDDVEVTAPAGAAYLYLNTENSQNYGYVCVMEDAPHYIEDIPAYLDAVIPNVVDPETGKSSRSNKLYRVPGPTNTTYSEWAWDGTNWVMMDNKDYGIDNFPKHQSPNVVKSSGIFDIVNKISEWEVLDPTVVSGKFMYTDGERDNSNMQYWKVPVIAGRNYCFSGYLPSSTNVPYYVWLDSNEEVLVASSLYGDGVFHTDVILYIPEGAAYLCLNVETQYAGYFKLKTDTAIKSSDLLYKQKELDDALSDYELIEEDTIVNGHFMTANGQGDNPSFSYKKYTIDTDKEYRFTGGFNENTNIPFVVFTTEDGIVTGVSPELGGTDPVSYTDRLVIPPVGSVYLCLNTVISSADKCYVKECNGLIQINQLKDRVDYIENKTNTDFFTLDRCCIRIDGSLWEDVDNVKATEFLPITGCDNIICTNLWTSPTVISLAFYDKDKIFISGVEGTQNPTGQNDINIAAADIPHGAAYIRCSANMLREGPHSVDAGVNASSVNANLQSVSKTVDEIDYNMTEKTFTERENYTVEPGGFYLDNGEWREFSSYQVYKYPITGGNTYAFSGDAVAGANLPYIVWADSNGLPTGFIGWSYKGSGSEPTQYNKQIIKAPSDASYLYLNMLTSHSSNFAVYDVEMSLIDVDALKKEVDTMSGGNKLMKVTVSGNNAYIRTKLDEENDIIIQFSNFENGNMTPIATFMGAHNADDTTILGNVIHNWGDSTAPLRAVPQYWHLYAQHGIPIPLVTITNNPLTDDDINSWWKDQSNREYQIGKINGNQVYLIPKVTQSGTPGIVTRSWRDSVHDSMPTSLTHVSGAVHTSALTIASSSQYQIRPIQSSTNRKFVCDGVEVGDGVYQCNTFVISETLTCIDVTHVTQYFPTVVSDQVAAYVTNSFIFKGTSIGFNQIFDCKNPIQFSYYGANQAMHFVDINDLQTYVMVPKVKKTIGGNVMAKLFRSTASLPDTTVYRTSTDLYDVNKAPDREISILKTSGGTNVIGFASGISLIKGVTRDEVRNTYIAEYEGSKGNALLLTPSYANKFYVGVITGANTDHFTDYLMQPDFCKEFSTYFTYFKPTDDIQSYWYNDGDTTVIYAHAESNIGRTYIDVSDRTSEGKMLEVVEKTDNANLVTDSIVNGKVCVSFTSNDANYIVLRTV